MTFIRVMLFAALIAVATVYLGWISVPVLGALYPVLVRERSAAGEAALAALLGWGGLLARAAMVPAFTTLLARLSGIFPVPGAALAVITLLFAAALAWSAARVVMAVVVRERRAVV